MSSSFFSGLFLLCLLDVCSSAHLDLRSHSSHYLSFGKLNQLLTHANNFPVASVTHHNRREKVPELPTEIIPAAHKII